MSRSYVTFATTCHTRIIDPVFYLWVRALNTVCKLLMKTNVLRMRVSHLYSDIYWPEAATPIKLVTYLLLRWVRKPFAAVNIEHQHSLQIKSHTRVMRVGTGLPKTQHEPQPHHFHVIFQFQLCDVLRGTGNNIAG